MEKKGLLISIEGIDGSGKSLLAKNLHQAMLAKQYDVILTKEFGATPLGAKLRKILHEEKKDVCDLAEYLLIAADRAQHFDQVVVPALSQNKIIISDRMADSSLAYQGYGRGIDIEMIKKVNTWAMQSITPDLTFFVEIDIKTALERVDKRQEKLTSFEKEKTDFWQKVSNGYEQIFKTKTNVIKLDGTLSPEKICDAALCEVEKYT